MSGVGGRWLTGVSGDTVLCHLQFNSGWPFKLTIDNAAQEVPGVNFDNVDPAGAEILGDYIGNFTDDEIHLNGLQTIEGSAGTYMAAVSPWFFTHFPPPLNKNVSPPTIHRSCIVQ